KDSIIEATVRRRLQSAPPRCPMRLFFLLATSIVTVGFEPAFGQDKSATLPQARFTGEWINESDEVFIANRLVITKIENNWSVEAFIPTVVVVDGAFKESDVSLGKTKLSLAGDSPDSNALPFGFTIRDLKLSIQYSSLRIEKDVLIVETFTVFP